MQPTPHSSPETRLLFVALLIAFAAIATVVGCWAWDATAPLRESL